MQLEAEQSRVAAELFAQEILPRIEGAQGVDGFLGPPPKDAFHDADAYLHRQTRFAQWAGRAGRVLEVDVARVAWADGSFARAYERGGWLLYTRPALLLWAVIVVAGLAAWWRQVLLAEHDLLQTNGSYTLGLLKSIPRLNAERKTTLDPIRGLPPDLIDLPDMCPFQPRCDYAEAICEHQNPPLREVTPGHQVACHFNVIQGKKV